MAAVRWMKFKQRLVEWGRGLACEFDVSQLCDDHVTTTLDVQQAKKKLYITSASQAISARPSGRSTVYSRI